MVCRNCGDIFPSSVVIDGIKRNLQNRKFCLVCSPFGEHNTKSSIVSDEGQSVCSGCGELKPFSEFCKKGKRRTSKCKSCLYLFQMRRWNSLKVKAINFMGGKCEVCGVENIHPVNFDFHHERDKEYTWTKMRLRSWESIVKELDKCKLLCCMCHRKEHINPDLWDF